MRVAHLMRPKTKLKKFPDRVISFDTETHPQGDYQNLTLGWLIYRDNKGTDSLEFNSLDQFWDYTISKAISKKPLTLVAHNVGFDSMVMEFENQLESRGFKITEFTIPMPFRVVATRGQQTIGILNLANFYGQMPLRKIGESVGLYKGEPEGGPADPRYFPENGCLPFTKAYKELSEYCLRDTEIVDKAVQDWTSFCSEHDLGSFAWTLAGQAKEAFIHRFMKHEIFIHDNEAATALEREAYHGGLTDVFRRGEFVSAEDGDFVKVDVNSMYPSIMRSQPVPVKLLNYFSVPCTSDDLRRILEEGYAVTARVFIDYENYEGSPFTAVVNDEHRLVLPKYNHWTVLSTPELRRAIENNMILECSEYAVYKQEVIFTEYVDYFYRLKNEYKGKNDVFYLIAKLFLNSLYGKFAQMSPVWEESPMVPENNVEDWVSPEGETFTLRRMGSRSEISRGEAPGEDTFIAIAGHITAYARMKLIDAKNVADGSSRHAYYGDTDSLIVDRFGYHNMLDAGLIDEDEIGYFSVEKIMPEGGNLRVTAPKDYAFDHMKNGQVKTEERRKGIRGDAERGDVIEGTFVPNPKGRSFKQVRFESILGAMRRGNVNSVKVTDIIKTPTGAYNKGVIGPDGWITPFTSKEQ